MRWSLLAVLGLASALSAPSNAAVTTNPADLTPYNPHVITFEDLSGSNGSAVTNGHYPALSLSDSMIVLDGTNLGSPAGSTSVRSGTIFFSGFANFNLFVFASPQMVAGFYYQDTLATSISVTAFDINDVTLDLATGLANSGYIGFIYASPLIKKVYIQATHDSIDDAIASRTVMDNIAYTDLPEPGSLAILAIGLGLGAVSRARRRQAQASA